MRICRRYRPAALSAPPPARDLLALAILISSSAAPVAALAQAVPTPPGSGAILQQRALPIAPPSRPASAGLTTPPPPQQDLPASVSVHVNTVVITGNRLIATADLQRLMAPTIGKTLTLADLDAAVAQVTAAYHAKGYPLAYAYLPRQQITDGDIQVRVVEPRYDKVVVKGNVRLKTSAVQSLTDIAPGESVTSAKLDRTLLLLNETPGVRVNGELAPGAGPDTSTLTLLVKDQPEIVGSLTEDNYGAPVTGAYLSVLAVTANDPFGYGESISANGMVSQNGDFYSGGLSATSPNIWNGLRAGLYGSSTFYRLGDRFTALDQVGSASEVGGDLTYPLVLTTRTSLAARIDVYNTWLNETTHSTGVYAEQVIPIGKFSLSGSFIDPFGAFISGSAAILKGNLNISPIAAAAIDASGPRAAGAFWISQLQADRQQSLGQGFALHLSFSGQISGQNLDSSQKFYIDGPMGMTGLPVGEVGGDEGYLMSARLSHVVTPFKLPGVTTLSLLGQTGALWLDHTPFAGGPVGRDLRESAIGGGLDYAFKGWTVSTILARRIGMANPLLGTPTRYQAWFVVSRSFGSPTPASN